MKKLLFPLVLGSALLLTGCLGGIMEFFCDFSADSDHCYQAAAVQEADPAGCANVKGKDFNAFQGNPPQDKCYLMIAVNTCDPAVCDKIKGGFISYTPEGCRQEVNVAKKEGKCPQEERGENGSERSSEGKRECTFDSDCGAVCEGPVLRQRGCTSAYTCELLRERADCAKEAESVATSRQTYTFPHTCLAEGKEAACAPDTNALKTTLQPEYEKLRQEFTNLQAGADDLRALYQKADKICLSTLSDVTNKLIVETALALKSPPKKMFDVLSDQVQNLINSAAELATKDGKPAPKMTASPEETIALWCNLTNEISRTEIPLLEKKRDKLMEDLKILKGALDGAK